MAPDTDIKFVKGIGPARALLLRDELGIKTADDLGGPSFQGLRGLL